MNETPTLDWWRCRATVLRVIDGDTFVADFDHGWGIWTRETPGRPNRVRLLLIDTPERNEPRYMEAGSLLTTYLGGVGAKVWVESHALDSFGRSLGVVTNAMGQNVRDLMPEEWWLRVTIREHIQMLKAA